MIFIFFSIIIIEVASRVELLNDVSDDDHEQVEDDNDDEDPPVKDTTKKKRKSSASSKVKKSKVERNHLFKHSQMILMIILYNGQ